MSGETGGDAVRDDDVETLSRYLEEVAGGSNTANGFVSPAEQTAALAAAERLAADALRYRALRRRGLVA